MPGVSKILPLVLPLGFLNAVRGTFTNPTVVCGNTETVGERYW
jgi:hypothetical protein